jgi:hypothetical protein
VEQVIEMAVSLLTPISQNASDASGNPQVCVVNPHNNESERLMIVESGDVAWLTAANSKLSSNNSPSREVQPSLGHYDLTSRISLFTLHLALLRSLNVFHDEWSLKLVAETNNLSLR